ncbi:MAG TPA: TMEM175 family protein [Candidatus Baltobacteraceae bacterium]|jgi:uncharacterized membrane protein|nr:TMEM175 family protein [Candidatus Baltobacteraceae bacterium]
MHRDESAERFIHRLESFSDIVIGFSLAQLGLNFTVPSHGIDLITSPLWFFSYLFAFAIVCSMWFFHHRLFSQFFVPKTWPIVLNFLWLGLLVLLVYFTLLYVRLAVRGDTVVMRLYFGGYAIAYLILAVQYLIGMNYLRGTLDEDELAQGKRGAAFMFLWMAPFLFCLIVTLTLQPGPLLGILIMLAFTLTGTASGVLGAYYRRA